MCVKLPPMENSGLCFLHSTSTYTYKVTIISKVCGNNQIINS